MVARGDGGATARVRLIPLLGLLVATASPVSAQRRDTLPPIDTDRPDFTDGTHTVARGRWQLETGYTYQQARGAGAGHAQSFPEGLFRVGVSDRIELRIGETFISHRPDPDASSGQGWDDAYVGTKVNVGAAHGAVPALSFELQARLPTGAIVVSGNSASHVLPGAAVLLAWESSSPWVIGVEGLVVRSADQHGQLFSSVSIQYSATRRAQFYGEYVMMQPIDAGAASPEHSSSAGVLVLLSNDIQVDARFGAGLNRAANQYSFGFGLSLRR
jgi:hypothetical protein